MPNPFGHPLICEVHGLAEIPPSRSFILDLPGPFNWVQASEFIAGADRNLDLNGELIQFAKTHEISFKKIEPLPETTRESTLSNMSKSGLWQAYSVTSSQTGIRYTIIIDYYDHSETILTNDEMKAQVMRFYHEEFVHFLLTEQQSGESGDPLALIMKIGEKIMYKFGIPFRKMGFFYDHIKEMSKFEKI